MEAVKKTIVTDKKIGKEISQLLIEGDIIVPDTKPDIDRLLKKSSQAYIESKELSKDRVSFKGSLDISVLYIARDNENTIHNMKVSAPINDFVNIEGTENDNYAYISCDISNIDYNVVNDRKVSFRAVIDVCAEVMGTEETEVAYDITELDEGLMKKEQINMSRVIANKEDKFTIKDEVLLPSGKPNIRELLDSNLSICQKEIKCGDGKVNISAILKSHILYKSDEDDGLIEHYESEIPFSGSIEVDKCKPSMTAEVNICLLKCSTKATEDEDNETRIIELEAEIGADIRLFDNEAIDILEDAYCLNKFADTRKMSMTYPYFICKNKNQFPIKEVVKLDIDSPPILQVLSTTGKAHIDSTRIIDDKIITEGIIEADILYVAGTDDTPLYCYSTVIPFTQSIEAKGARAENPLLMDLYSYVEHIGVNMLSDNEVELRCVINFDLLIREERYCDIILDIDFQPLDENAGSSIASMIIYVVQKGDTLWKLAKRYNTTVADIIEINNIENPDLIYPGQRFLIIKRVE